MKLNRGKLRRLIKETLEKVDWNNPGASWGANDQDSREREQEYASSGTFSSAGSEAKHAARRKEERAASTSPGRDIYALISIPYEGSMVISADTLEEIKEEIATWTNSGAGASLEAIFYADIIEGEL